MAHSKPVAPEGEPKLKLNRGAKDFGPEEAVIRVDGSGWPLAPALAPPSAIPRTASAIAILARPLNP